MVIRYSKDALKFLNRLDKKSVARIGLAVEGLTHKPPLGDIKEMRGSKAGRLRLRVGGWRIIFQYGAEGEIEIIFVLEIGNRGDIYK